MPSFDPYLRGLDLAVQKFVQQRTLHQTDCFICHLALARIKPMILAASTVAARVGHVALVRSEPCKMHIWQFSSEWQACLYCFWACANVVAACLRLHGLLMYVSSQLEEAFKNLGQAWPAMQEFSSW